jgi:nucleoside-triphosphatase
MKVLLQGRPGVGKTTAAVRLADRLRDRGVAVRGFVTRELRERGRRVGFMVETFDGRTATLAHVDFRGPPTVGKYGVDLEAFERVALPSLERLPRRCVVVVDELGKMELASEPFRDAVARLFDQDLQIAATVHVFRHPLTDALKRRPGIERAEVTRATRDALPQELVTRFL